MKWPNSLIAIRHGESAYNELKALKEADPLYKEFKRAYNRRKKDPEHARDLAEQLMKLGTFALGVSDQNTPLTERGHRQARITGSQLSDLIEVPDIILVSPYLRTHETLDGMTEGWPDLASVKTLEEDRLREQGHGLATLYNDWRIFQTMHPEEGQLRDRDGPYWYKYPGGENVPDVRERLRSEMITITRDYHEQNVLMVIHHITLLAMRANLERLDAKEYCRLDEEEKPVNCGFTKYQGYPDLGEDGKLLLETYNQRLYPEDL